MSVGAALAALVILSGESVAATEHPLVGIEREVEGLCPFAPENVLSIYLDRDEQGEDSPSNPFDLIHPDEGRGNWAALKYIPGSDSAFDGEIHKIEVAIQCSRPRDGREQSYIDPTDYNVTDPAVLESQPDIRDRRPIRRVDKRDGVNGDAGLISRQEALFRYVGGFQRRIGGYARCLLPAQQEEQLNHPEPGQGTSQTSEDLRVISDTFACEDIQGGFLALLLSGLLCLPLLGFVALNQNGAGDSSEHERKQ